MNENIMTLYKGYSTLDYASGASRSGLFPSNNISGFSSPLMNSPKVDIPGSNTFILTDIKLVERNLLNHIFTKKGERVMMPTFGTIIPELLFEPLDDDLMNTVRDEIEAVIKYDPRVRMISLSVTPNYELNSISVSATLQYIELNVTHGLNFNIDLIQ